MINPRFSNKANRRGVIAPLMALLLPVMLLLCGIIVNIAYMQLNRTELRVATDASARAAGRAFSEFQNVDIAVGYALTTGQMNNVGSKQFQLDPRAQEHVPGNPDFVEEISFGSSNRLDSGFGRYEFLPRNRTAVRNKTQKATAIRITGRRTTDSFGGSIRMLFAGWGPFTEFEPVVASTATQVDRDIALVLDRSGSMLEYKDFATLSDRTNEIKNDGIISSSTRNKALGHVGARRFYYTIDRPDVSWDDIPDYQHDFYQFYLRGYQDEWEYAKDMEDRTNTYYTYGQYYTNDGAPRHSRWHQLDLAVNEFLDVLENTDQEERVAMITFNNYSSKNLSLTSSYDSVRSKVASIPPKNGTNISSGMQRGLDSIINVPANPNARPYAAKTIIVLTDGEHNAGNPTPTQKASSLVASYNVVIHTVTFSKSVTESSKATMREVARIGGGRHYHADTGDQLESVFREIANNLPTIITE